MIENDLFSGKTPIFDEIIETIKSLENSINTIYNSPIVKAALIENIF
jgi:hypothetical protein